MRLVQHEVPWSSACGVHTFSEEPATHKKQIQFFNILDLQHVEFFFLFGGLGIGGQMRGRK
jgi:hypothetical protein